MAMATSSLEKRAYIRKERELMSEHFDYFVIGAGSGGVRSARIAASHGAKVGIAEYSDLGGTCVNLGCVPKKILSYASDFYNDFKDSTEYGWDVHPSPTFSWKKLIENKDNEIKRLNGIYKKVLENNNVKIFKGKAHFQDSHTIQINENTITADKILIATGGNPNIPDITGCEHMLSSDQIFHLEDLPETITILGAGYIGVEFAHIFSGLGSKVNLIHRGPTLLKGFERYIAESLYDEMTNQGVHIELNCTIDYITQQGDKKFITTTCNKNITSDVVLSATGRTPHLEGLGLENTHIELTDKGQIATNDYYQTSTPHIYAVGDVTNQHNLTPVAISEGHVLADRLFGKQSNREVNYQNIATAVFSSPPIGTVGITEEEAIKSRHSVKVFQTDFKPLKNTISGNNARTYIKLIVDAVSDKVLGVHILGEDSPEMIQGIAIALNCGATKADFDRTMPIHPTSAEEIVTLRTERKAT